MAQDERGPCRQETARRLTAMETFKVCLYTGPLSPEEYIAIEVDKTATSTEVLRQAVRKLRLGNPDTYEIAEVLTSGGQLCKERRLEGMERPVGTQLLWKKVINADADNGSGLTTGYRFYIKKKDPDTRTTGWLDYKDANSKQVDTFLMSFLEQPLGNKEYPDLCNLPDLNERTLLENLRARFKNSNIYTYVGSILIALNPFKFFPIYNPKYVKMYQNKRLGELPPHIFAIADAAYHTMLRSKQNQCIVISGESGSGKTESTNLLLHHLTALSHKGLHGSGVEQTILGAGPVLEAFGNAKTVHNNNSSRFGKFIQVNYKENGMVHGAIVEKYLLEKTRIVSQAKDERNYHVFYYLLAGATDEERRTLELQHPEDYFYLSESSCSLVENPDAKKSENPDAEEFARLKQSMEMVGFSQETQRRIFSVLSAVLHLGNIEFRKKGEQHRDESVAVKNDSSVFTISNLLKVKERTLIEALTQKKTTAGDETVVINYRMEDAVATRDAMAKCLYGALFDWIVLKVNQALLAKKHNSEHQHGMKKGNSIGVLDIFGFEDFGNNSFEQFCINYANEHLQYYFNQHIFKLEQEEYQREGIQWKNIEFIDNTACLELFSKRNVGLFSLLDEECNFPAATNESLLSKFTHHHKNNVYYEVPQRREGAFVIVHYAGKVKYNVKDFREKNSDLIRTDIVGVLKKSSLSFVREIMGIDPVAVLRWAIVRAFFRCFFAFVDAGKRHQTSGCDARRKNRHSDSQLVDNVFSDNLLRFYHVAHTIKVLRKIHGQGGHEASPRDQQRAPLTNMHAQRHACSEPQATEGLSDEEAVFRSQAVPLSAGIPLSPRCSPQSNMEAGFLPSSLESSLPEAKAKVIRKARKVMMKNKSFKPKPRPSLSFHDIKTLKAIASRTMFGGMRMGSKTRPPSVGVQFQWSLTRLMNTLNQANPFFIRCIKSNGEKAQCVFDDEIVLRQLRYTGMLATVRIRQSGYNYRLTFEEFIQLYKILLPRGLLSSKEDVGAFLKKKNLNTENYQIGRSKVFLRESEKMLLDEALHSAIMERVIRIQRWMKTILERQSFLKIRTAVLIVQKYVRRYMAQRQLRILQCEQAAIRIQQFFRAYHQRCRFLRFRSSVVCLQAHCHGYLARKRVVEMREALRLRKLEEEKALRQKTLEDMQSSTSDEGVLLKGSSAEELEKDFVVEPKPRRDSEESSGILEDSETEAVPPEGSPQVAQEEEVMEAGAEEEPGEEALTPVTSSSPTEEGLPETPTPSGVGQASPASPSRDPYLEQARSTSRVQELARTFQQSPGNDERDGKTIFIRRGSRHRRGRPAGSVAPLAKQESFSDLELSPVRSPPEVPAHTPLSSDALQAIKETVAAKARDKPPQQLLEPGAGGEGQGQGHMSPFHKAKRHLKNFMGDLRDAGSCAPSSYEMIRRTSIRLFRKDSGQRQRKGTADSDEEGEEATPSPSHRPQNLGVQVLPAHPQSTPPTAGGSPGKDASAAVSQEWQRNRDKRKRKNKPRRPASVKSQSPNQSRTNWKIAGTSQWQYPVDLVMTDLSELQALDEFIGKKYQVTFDAATKEKRMNVIDKVFKGGIEDFRKELKAIISVEVQHKETTIRYRDLLEKFEEIVWACVKREHLSDQFPTPMIINSFRSFLDEFLKQQKERKKEKKKEDKKPQERARRDKGKKEVIQEHLGHRFLQVQFNIPTFCEFCSNIIWIMEKGQVCQVCKYTCHKKCFMKSTSACKGLEQQGPGGGGAFGQPLQRQLSGDMLVPAIPERLINAIEIHGMFTEGIYRKSGAAPKAKLLRQALETDPDSVNLDDFQVHVLASTLKSYFRELPEPLLTFELYDEFLRATEIKDERERIQSLFAVIKRLPKANHDMFERLIFHLARVAMHQDCNKMTTEGLAIIFAPCLLRSSKNMQAQEALSQVARQNTCINCILTEQLKRVKITLADIHTLESAENTASERLSRVRQSIRTPKPSRPVSRHELPEVRPLKEEEDEERLKQEEKVLFAHIQSIHEERNCLTYKLPVLEPRQASSDEDALTGDECESSYDLMNDDDENNEEYAVSFDFPVTPPSLQHPTKRRVTPPLKRPPSRYCTLLALMQRQVSLDDVDILFEEEEPLANISTDNRFALLMDQCDGDSNYVSIRDLGNGDEDDEIMV